MPLPIILTGLIFLMTPSFSYGVVFGQTNSTDTADYNNISIVGNNTIDVTGNITETTTSNTSTAEQWLAHPFVLLIIGASISGILIPLFTRRWQDHQKELEVKVGLVNKINESLTDIITAIKLVDCKIPGFDKAALGTAYKEWEKSNAVIRSQLRAYFSNTNLEQDWNNYSQLIFKLYSLLEKTDSIGRKQLLQEIKNAISSGKNTINPDTIARNPPDKESWNTLKGELLAENDKLTQKVLRERIPLFSIQVGKKRVP
jgi:hypothetical protein